MLKPLLFFKRNMEHPAMFSNDVESVVIDHESLDAIRHFWRYLFPCVAIVQSIDTCVPNTINCRGIYSHSINEGMLPCRIGECTPMFTVF